MGDPKNLKATPISFAPGIRFYPNEEQLCSFYLTNKNTTSEHHALSLSSTSDSDHSLFGFNLVSEIDLYNYDPCNLPDIACFPFGPGGSKKHWYCFTAKVVSERAKRKARGGFWRRKGRSRDVVGGKEGGVLGTRKGFVFYRRNSSQTVKTDWVMYEYALVDRPKEDSFVLCRIFFKSLPGNKILEHVPNSFADKNVAARHENDIDVPYKQHDGALASGIGELVVHGKTNNEIQRLPTKLISELDDPIVSRQASDDSFRFPMVVPQPAQLVRSSNGIISGSTVCGGAVTEERITDSVILEEDFIELNDLISPLPKN